MNCCPNILISLPENCLEEFGLLLPISHDRVLILWFHPKSLVSPETFWWSCSDFMITPKITGLTWNCQSHPRTFETYWPPCPTIKEIHDHTLNIPYLDPLTEIAWLSCIVKNPPQVWSSQAWTSQFRATISGHGMHLPSSRICTSVDPKSWMSPQIPDEPPNLGGGHGLDCQCWKMRHMNTRSWQVSLLLQNSTGTQCTQWRKDPLYLSLMQVMYLSPSHLSGQGPHFFVG